MSSEVCLSEGQKVRWAEGDVFSEAGIGVMSFEQGVWGRETCKKQGVHSFAFGAHGRSQPRRPTIDLRLPDNKWALLKAPVFVVSCDNSHQEWIQGPRREQNPTACTVRRVKGQICLDSCIWRGLACDPQVLSMPKLSTCFYLLIRLPSGELIKHTAEVTLWPKFGNSSGTHILRRRDGAVLVLVLQSWPAARMPPPSPRRGPSN